MRANCPACGSTRKRIDDWVLDFKVPDGWPQPKSNTVCLCTSCGLIYYDNDMTAEGYDEYYRNYYGADFNLDKGQNNVRLDEVAALVQPLNVASCRATGRLLAGSVRPQPVTRCLGCPNPPLQAHRTNP